jgi:hypothetical protein
MVLFLAKEKRLNLYVDLTSFSVARGGLEPPTS